jgi:hypothetical protein
MPDQIKSSAVVRYGSSVLIAAVLFCAVSVLAAAKANAAFEQVGCFAGHPVASGGPKEACQPVAEEKFSEEVQLGGLGGMAVNYTGAGGVPAGTVYVATLESVAMYEPKAGGGLTFVMAWKPTYEGTEYFRCGPPGELPDGETVHPTCPLPQTSSGKNVDVDVDQTTGNVYVQIQTGNPPAGADVIIEYPADGGEIITRFGELAAGGESVDASPGKIHGVAGQGGIAVGDSGEVYVADRGQKEGRNFSRLMKFKPKVAGKFDEYEYAGEDVGAVFGLGPQRPVLDKAGNVYAVTNEQTIEEYDPDTPASPAVCKFIFPAGNVQGITVDPLTGAVFFYAGGAPKRVHRLSLCNESTGTFTEVGQIEVSPARAELRALAYDPSREFPSGRPAGVLYGGAPGPVPIGGGGEPGQSSLGYIFAPSPEIPPVVKAAFVTNVTGRSATFNAVVNPEGFATRYVFQYLTAAAFFASGESFAGAAEVPAGGGVVGEGKADISVAATAINLEPDTEYRYRVVASSACSGDPEHLCQVAGATEPFRTYPPATGMPDNRTYELVSPAEKNGGQVFPIGPRIKTCTDCKPGLGLGRFPIQSSPDGEAIVYEGTAFGFGVGAANENEYLARRTGTGWQTSNPTPPLLRSRGGGSQGAGEGYKAFAENLDGSIVEQPSLGSLTPDAPVNYENIYSQPTADPLAIRPLVGSPPPHRSVTEFAVKSSGAAVDLSRVFFAANDALTEASDVAPAAEDGGAPKFNLYEWERATGTLRLVNVKPGNGETEAGAAFGLASANSISADGNRAFFSFSGEENQVYVREGATLTQKIPDSGKFLAAATDGSKVLLSTGVIYDLETGLTSDLTEGAGGFQGIAGQSDNLSHVYFVDTKVLSGEEENSEGDKAQPTKPNLYAWSEGTTRFVATLLASDETGIEGTADTGIRSDWALNPSTRTAKASPQGRYVAFESTASLTGYDNVGPAGARCAIVNNSPIIFGPGPCAEVFLYDSITGELRCASCNPSGAAPLGWAQLPLIEVFSKQESLPQPSVLTDSGRLYFDTGDSLSQLDTNGGAQDVYEWEPAGVGSCSRATGCLGLISAGTGSEDSNFVDADSAGKNVFFTTRDRLRPADKDELIDLYDAREFGGFPGESTLAPSECQGEACQAVNPPPAEPPPGSSTLNGQGNGKQPKSCKKGQVKKKGKCVKAHKPKHKKPGKHKKKSAPKHKAGKSRTAGGEK